MVKIEVEALIDGCGIDKYERLIASVFEELQNFINQFYHCIKTLEFLIMIVWFTYSDRFFVWL